MKALQKTKPVKEFLQRAIILAKSSAGTNSRRAASPISFTKGIRSVDCFNEDGAKRAKAHYNANVLAIPAEFVNLDTAINIIRAWLGTEVLGGRYKERIDVIKDIEKENMK